MNDRQRLTAILDFQPVDRLPVYYFGLWDETAVRWRNEGWSADELLEEATGMDADWEAGMWAAHDLVYIYPISHAPVEVLEETDEWRVIRNALGTVLRESKVQSTLSQHISPAMEPTRASWERFKAFMDPNDPSRRPPGWEARADALQQRTRTATTMAGSLYGWLREWMGVEGISFLLYDEPELCEEILDYFTEWFIAMYRPVLERVTFEFAYFWEDCCGNTGPLFSPDTYRSVFHKYYARLVEFYHGMGIRHCLMDSDGRVDALVRCWLDSGFDILFPMEVGTWRADPVAFRREYGANLRMMGGVDKHVIPQGEAAIRAHLEHLLPLVEDGGYLPLPDHRIPPECSFEDFKTYIRVYKDLFGIAG